MRLTPWAASRQPQDFPEAWADKLQARHSRHRVDAPEALLVLSVESEAAAEWAAEPGRWAALSALLDANAPHASVLDVEPDAVGWDSPLTPALTADRVVGLLRSLADLAPPLPPAADPEAESTTP